MEIVKRGMNMSNKILSDEQLEILKGIGICMIATSGKDNFPHCTIVEPSVYENNRIIIPVVQMVTSKKNIEENKNICLHFYKEDESDPELNVQYKINAEAELQFDGDLFWKVKHYEETEVLPEGFFVSAIVVANLKSVEEFVG